MEQSPYVPQSQVHLAPPTGKLRLPALLHRVQVHEHRGHAVPGVVRVLCAVRVGLVTCIHTRDLDTRGYITIRHTWPRD